MQNAKRTTGADNGGIVTTLAHGSAYDEDRSTPASAALRNLPEVISPGDHHRCLSRPPPGETVAAGILFGHDGAREAGHNRREQ